MSLPTRCPIACRILSCLRVDERLVINAETHSNTSEQRLRVARFRPDEWSTIFEKDADPYLACLRRIGGKEMAPIHPISKVKGFSTLSA
jgi:hypothetical protein